LASPDFARSIRSTTRKERDAKGDANRGREMRIETVARESHMRSARSIAAIREPEDPARIERTRLRRTRV